MSGARPQRLAIYNGSLIDGALGAHVAAQGTVLFALAGSRRLRPRPGVLRRPVFAVAPDEDLLRLSDAMAGALKRPWVEMWIAAPHGDALQPALNARLGLDEPELQRLFVERYRPEALIWSASLRLPGERLTILEIALRSGSTRRTLYRDLRGGKP